MENYKKFTKALTDEELMELTGGFVDSEKTNLPIITVKYGVKPILLYGIPPILLYGIQPLYGIKITKTDSLS